MAVSYVFLNDGVIANPGQYEAPDKTTPTDINGGPNAVQVIINSGVARGDVEKILRKAIKYASSDYVPTVGA